MTECKRYLVQLCDSNSVITKSSIYYHIGDMLSFVSALRSYEYDDLGGDLIFADYHGDLVFLHYENLFVIISILPNHISQIP